MTPDVQEAFVEFMKVLNHPHQWYGGRTYAQHGDDLAIINLFQCLRIEKPSYLDIGAHHPFNLSNTALLYARGSRGVNVEANPDLIDNFRRLRPEDKNVWAAITAEREDHVKLNRINDSSGINSLLAIDEKLYGPLMDSVDVPAWTADDIVTTYAEGHWPDLLSLDAEGLDIPILRSINFDVRPGPKVICAEFVSGGGDVCDELRRLMTNRGYTVHSFCGSNMLLVRSDMVDMCR